MSTFASTRCLLARASVIAARQWPWTMSHARAGRYCTTVLSQNDKTNLLVGIDPANKEAVTRILELGRMAADRWEIAHSDFLDLQTLSDALLVLRRTADIGIVVSGGFAEVFSDFDKSKSLLLMSTLKEITAERCRISMGNSEAMTYSVRQEIESSSVAALSVSGNFKLNTVAHGDFLDSILDTGVVPEKVGDIILKGDGGAQMLVVPEVVGFLCGTLTQVKGVPVETTANALSDLEVKVMSKDVVRTLEASLRVDAVASAGFRLSRERLREFMRISFCELENGNQACSSCQVRRYCFS